MALRLEPGHQGAQARPDQAGRLDPGRQPRIVDLLAMRAPVGRRPVLGDDDGFLGQVHLLEDAGGAFEAGAS